MADGTIDIEITADASKAEGTLAGVGDAARGVASTAGRALGAAAAAGVAGVAAMGKAALDSYARWEQLAGGVDTLFKGASATVQGFAAEAYRTAGLSANDYMEQVTGFSAKLIGDLGGDTQAAAVAANTAVTDMADNVNKMGSSMTDVQNAYQGFAKQNYTMLDNLKLGYGGTQAEMARLVNESGVMGDSFVATADNINQVSFDKIIEAIHVTQENLGIAGATAQEAATTIEGSVSSMSAAWENWLAGLGQDGADMGALTDQLLDAVGNVAANVGPRVAQIATAISAQLPVLAQTVISALPGAIASIGSWLAANGPMLATYAVQFFGALATGLVQAAPQVLLGLGQMLVVIVQALAGWVAQMAQKGAEAGAQLLAGLGQWLVQLPGQLAAWLLSGIATLGGWSLQFAAFAIQAGAQFLADLGAFMLQLPGQVAAWLAGVISSVASWVGDMAGRASAAGSQFVGNVTAFISQLPGQVAGFLSGVIGNVANFVADMAGKAVQAASEFAGNLISGLASIPGRVASIGADIIHGIVSGITGAAGSVVSAVTDAVGGAINAAKSFLGIASPSKVMRDQVGRWMPRGVAVGIEDNARYVSEAMDRALEYDPTVALDRSISLSATAPQPMPVTQTVNFYQPAETPDELARTMRMYATYGLGAMA